MLPSLCLTHPTSVLWVCSYLNNSERFKVGLCSTDLFELLNPLFQSLVYLKKMETKKRKYEKRLVDIDKTLSENKIYPVPVDLLVKYNETRILFKQISLNVGFGQFWSNFNEVQLTRYYNPLLIDGPEAHIFYNDESRLKSWVFKKMNAQTAEVALHHASISPSTLNYEVDLLCRHVTNINAPSSTGHTALHRAVEARQVNIVTILLHHNANCNVKNKHDETPLHFAASVNSCEIVTLLLKRGADPKAKDKSGFTPLDWALMLDKRESAAILCVRTLQQ